MLTVNVRAEPDKKYIKWVDFTPSAAALLDTAEIDIETYKLGKHISWIELLSCLSLKNGGNYSKYRSADARNMAELLSQGKSPVNDSNRKTYNYYLEAYTAVLGGLLGEYTHVTVEKNGKETKEACYGVCAYSPIAKGYHYSDYDDFGASRSFGYKRKHLGHDMMGSVGTPIIAVESGYVEACGWNMYGGWRIGIRSFDGKRYYYYAHLRKNHPYNDIFDGKIVNAGEVIGYLGMTGYSTKENVNNIDTPHLHFGTELIFDVSQKDGYNQIWIDVHEICDFLKNYRAPVAVIGDEFSSMSYNIANNSPD